MSLSVSPLARRAFLVLSGNRFSSDLSLHCLLCLPLHSLLEELPFHTAYQRPGTSYGVSTGKFFPILSHHLPTREKRTANPRQHGQQGSGHVHSVPNPAPPNDYTGSHNLGPQFSHLKNGVNSRSFLGCCSAEDLISHMENTWHRTQHTVNTQ